jgi:hypothetical protein
LAKKNKKIPPGSEGFWFAISCYDLIASLNQKLPLSRGVLILASLLERGEDERFCEHIGQKYTTILKCVKGILENWGI